MKLGEKVSLFRDLEQRLDLLLSLLWPCGSLRQEKKGQKQDFSKAKHRSFITRLPSVTLWSSQQSSLLLT